MLFAARNRPSLAPRTLVLLCTNALFSPRFSDEENNRMAGEHQPGSFLAKLSGGARRGSVVT
jgi:hypothetical protein